MSFDKKKLIKDIASSGLRKDFICKKAEIHRSYLYMILTGTREPSVDVIKRIYRVLIGEVR
jgi:predicted transcriptional regulator